MHGEDDGKLTFDEFCAPQEQIYNSAPTRRMLRSLYDLVLDRREMRRMRRLLGVRQGNEPCGIVRRLLRARILQSVYAELLSRNCSPILKFLPGVSRPSNALGPSGACGRSASATGRCRRATTAASRR